MRPTKWNILLREFPLLDTNGLERRSDFALRSSPTHINIFDGRHTVSLTMKGDDIVAFDSEPVDTCIEGVLCAKVRWSSDWKRSPSSKGCLCNSTVLFERQCSCHLWHSVMLYLASCSKTTSNAIVSIRSAEWKHSEFH